VLLSLSN